MVAFSSEGWRDYQLFVNKGDPAVKQVAGTGVAGNIAPEIVHQLPDEKLSEEIRLGIVATLKSGTAVSENLTLQILLNALERYFPMIIEIADKNLHMLLQGQRDKLYALFLTYIPLRGQKNPQNVSD